MVRTILFGVFFLALMLGVWGCIPASKSIIVTNNVKGVSLTGKLWGYDLGHYAGQDKKDYIADHVAPEQTLTFDLGPYATRKPVTITLRGEDIKTHEYVGETSMIVWIPDPPLLCQLPPPPHWIVTSLAPTH